MQVEFKGKLDILSIITTETLNSIMNLILIRKNRRESFKKSW